VGLAGCAFDYLVFYAFYGRFKIIFLASAKFSHIVLSKCVSDINTGWWVWPVINNIFFSTLLQSYIKVLCSDFNWLLKAGVLD
jgi:hypothetical protein